MRSKSDGQGLLPQEQTIYDRLAAALHPLRVQWLADAADRHTVHFMTIHDRLPHARRRLQDIDARIVEYNGQLYVTCHIAGRRQAPVRIRPDLWQAYRTQPGADKTSLAAAHFPRQIAEALKALTSGISATDLGSTLKIK